MTVHNAKPRTPRRAFAERTLVRADDPTKSLTVRVFAPERVAPDEWSCAISVAAGTTNLAERRVFGIDGLQALALAIEALRLDVEDQAGAWTWAGGAPGDPGLPRVVASPFGREFSARLNRQIDAAIDRHAKSRTGK